MVYEGVLLFGIVAGAGLFYAVIMQQRHALQFQLGLKILLFAVVGMYFVWCWTHGGQTLPMKTWRIRLVGASGEAVGIWRALLRYALAWMWFIPGLAAAWLIGAREWQLAALPCANFVLWALAVYVDPERQFLHDRIAGTRLVLLPKSQVAA